MAVNQMYHFNKYNVIHIVLNSSCYRSLGSTSKF